MLNTQDFIIFIYDRVYKNAFTYVLHADHLKIQIRISAWLPRFTHITFISRNTLIFKLHQPLKSFCIFLHLTPPPPLPTVHTPNKQNVTTVSYLHSPYVVVAS